MGLYKFALAPLLLTQARRLRRSAMRLPEPNGERQGTILTESGTAEVNLLFVGDSTIAGVGVTEQRHALGPRCAEAVSKQLSRSVSWQVVAKSGLVAGRALDFSKRHVLQAVNVVVIALGTNDVLGQTYRTKFIEDYRTLVEGLESCCQPSLIVVNGMPPLHLTPALPQPLRWFVGEYARVLDRDLKRWTTQHPELIYVSLQWASDTRELAVDGFHPGERQYGEWAEQIARRIVAHFCAVGSESS